MMHFQAQENNSSHSDFSVDFHAGIRYHKDMENILTAYTKADKEAVRILRSAYSHTLSSEIVKGMDHGVSDTLYNARQYLQDRARYERLNLTVGREYVTMLQEMTA
jgi:hypothetical protein